MQDETKFEPCSSQVVEKLRLSRWIQPVASFEFQQNNGLDDHVSAKDTDLTASEVDRNGNLSFDSQSLVQQRPLHSPRIHRFEIPRSELAMDLVERSKNPIRDPFVKEFAHKSILSCRSFRGIP